MGESSKGESDRAKNPNYVQQTCILPSDQLSLDNLGDLLEAIYTANPKWYNLGLRLGLHPSVLDAIRTRCQHNPEECLVEVLKEWLKRGGTEPTWRELARALMSTAVGEGALAGKLLAKCHPLDPVQQQSVESGKVVV